MVLESPSRDTVRAHSLPLGDASQCVLTLHHCEAEAALWRWGGYIDLQQGFLLWVLN